MRGRGAALGGGQCLDGLLGTADGPRPDEVERGPLAGARALTWARTASRSGVSPAAVAGWAASTPSYWPSREALTPAAFFRSEVSTRSADERSAAVRASVCPEPFRPPSPSSASLPQPASAAPMAIAPVAVSAPLRVVPVRRTCSPSGLDLS